MIKSRYAKKQVNPNFFTITKISGNGEEPKILTEEEFRTGVAGTVYMDKATGRIICRDSLTILEKAFRKNG